MGSFGPLNRNKFNININMSKFLQRILVILTVVMLMTTVHAQQLPNAGFEDWSGAAFDGNAQPASWNASNVTQFGFKFNFAHKEAGHNGGYSMMVQDQSVGAAGITEVSPGYFSLGQPWVYIASLTAVSGATAGTAGGVNWTYRPDTMSVWIKRTGNNVDKEDFYLLYYTWEREAQGTAYKGKNGNCTSYSRTNEESDIRIALDGNECSTTQDGKQVAEGMWREKKEYGDWTNIRVPIYYLNSNAAKYMNIIFSASNYPNFRANSGLYEGNSLYIDDVELIYSSKIQTLLIDGITWNGFDPNSTEVQTYSLGENATTIPDITAKRGAGSITNARGTTKAFPGRLLDSKEMKVVKGDLTSTPTVITVTSDDGRSTTVYKIQFQKAASSNAKLAGIGYTLNGVDTIPMPDFSPNTSNYVLSLPYGTTTVPQLSYTPQENGQTVQIKQATSLTGSATIRVTAPNKTDTRTYSVSFTIADLADNNLAGIKVNGNDLPGFSPSQLSYKVSLPVGTSSLSVEAVKKYDGQTVTITPANMPTGDAINGSVIELAVTTPGNQTPRKYRLTIKLEASSYSYLGDLKIEGSQILKVNPAQADDSTQIDFTPENMVYYVTLKKGTTELPTITPVKGDQYQNDVDIVTGGLDGITRIKATAANGNESIYKIYFSTVKSTNTKLAGIQIGDQALEGFDPNVTSYAYELPVGTTELPKITWTPGDEFQNVQLVTRGINGTTSLSVIAGNGETKIYNIAFSVKTFTDNRLKSLSVNGASLQNKAGQNVEFDPEVKEYWVKLGIGTDTVPQVNLSLNNSEYQDTTIASPAKVPGNYKITVIPTDGASRTYTIHFTVDVSYNTALKMIYVDGEAIRGFDPEKLDYLDTLAMGVTDLPVVTWDKSEATQQVESFLNKRTVRLVVSQSGSKRTYTVRFIMLASNNTQLANIRLAYGTDTIPLDGYRKDSSDYIHYLQAPTCPRIVADASAGQQVTIAAPYAEGTATIRVQSEDGSENTYTIEFMKAVPASLKLQRIYFDVEDQAHRYMEFNQDVFHYEITRAALPKVIYELQDGVTDVKDTLLWKKTANKSIAYITVRDKAGNEVTYDFEFTLTVSSSVVLKSIKANGTLIDGFDPEQTDYQYNLAAGQNYPELSYEVSEKTQVVFFGQVAEGKWEIKVRAEDAGFDQTYTVQYTLAKHSDALLEKVQTEGGSDIVFYPETTSAFPIAPKNKKAESAVKGQVLTCDPIEIGEGEPLPKLLPFAKDGENQKVMISNLSDSLQEVLVMAEDGKDSTRYKIRYARVPSHNANLQKIYINGKEYQDFDQNTLSYTYELPVGTTVVPNVFAVGQLDNQVITTTFGRVNEATTIKVDAQDGTTSKIYTINFPVTLSSNTKLGSLKIDGVAHSVDSIEYIFDMPFGSTQPYSVEYEPADGHQLIQFVDAPITGVTKITVTAQNGDSRTYTIRYNIAEPEGENIVPKIEYSYRIGSAQPVKKDFVPVKGNNIVELPVGATSFAIDSVHKNYDEQSMVLFKGGIRRGAKIIAVANRTGAADVEYTITPYVKPDTIGKLKDLKFNDVTVPNFRPDVYNYIVNVTEEPSQGDFTYTKYVATDDVNKSTIDSKKKQITISVEGGQTYSVCWFYYEDKDPFDFREDWVTTTYNGASKPSPDWKVYTDVTPGNPDMDFAGYPIPFYAGKEVGRYGENGVLLSTMRQGAIRCSVPGMMTLGSIAADFKKGGLTHTDATSSVGKNATLGVTFRNTPEQFTFQYNCLKSEELNDWRIWITLSNGTTYKESTFNGNYSIKNKLISAHLDLSYPDGVTNILNATLNSSNKENCKDFGSLYGKVAGDLVLQNMHLTYNSALTAVTVNGEATTLSGNTFNYNATGKTIIGLPALMFTGAVHDQTQTIEWLNNGEWIEGKLTAKVINYGENALDELRDSTIYFVVLTRAPEESLNYTASFGNFSKTENTAGDTTFVHLPFATRQLPSLKITPENDNQRFTITKQGDAVTVTVTNEKNISKTMVYVFRQQLSTEAKPESISAEDRNENAVSFDKPFEASELNYTIEADTMPTFTVVKYGTGEDKMLNQTVDLKYTATSAIVKITAEDGKTTNTYTFTLKKSTVPTGGQISSFYVNGDSEALTGFGGTNYAIKAAKPEMVSFTRQYDADSVRFVQTPAGMSWTVPGKEPYEYSYPTDLSSNDKLKQVLVEGEPLADFDPANDAVPYPVYADTTQIMEAVPGEASQTIVSTMTPITGGAEFKLNVKAANGENARTYTFRMLHPMDTRSTLDSIMLDSVKIDGFYPDITDYTITLPIGNGPKTENTKMPDLTYAAGHKGQTIEVTPGTLNGEPSVIVVTNEKGDAKTTYKVTINDEKSRCTELTGIFVNGKPLPDFVPTRNYYSTSVERDDEISINYTCEDRFFQKVDTIKQVVSEGHQYNYILRVTAEDGTTADYTVNIFVESQSNDADLADILLDGSEIINFRRELNPNIKPFDPGMNSYEINVPADSVPNVSTRLKAEGQAVSTSVTKEDAKTTVIITVTAADQTTTKNYTVYLIHKLPQVTNLTEIRVKTVPVENFSPGTHYYIFDKLTMEEELPTTAEIEADLEDDLAKYEVAVEPDKNQATITVTAQDPTVTEKYVITFLRTPSNVDTLELITELYKGVEDVLEGFSPTKFFYNRELPVGSVNFPEISYGDERYPGDGLWPSIQVVTDTIDSINMTRMHQTLVTAQSGRTNTYTISYRILKSDNNKLDGILISKDRNGALKALDGFEPLKEEYYCTLTAEEAEALNGDMPIVEARLGDEYQDTVIYVVQDSLSGKSLGYKHVITVTAASGFSRSYIIHYPVEPSSEANLNMIMLEGKPLANFDAERYSYKVEIESNSAIPVVSVIKKEEAQIYEIRVMNDTVRIEVMAESRKEEDTRSYTIAFERVLSGNTRLNNIILTDTAEAFVSVNQFRFNPAWDSYTVDLNYEPGMNKKSLLPKMEIDLADSLQTYRVDTTELEDGSLRWEIIVVAPNQDKGSYFITFTYTKPGDNNLTAIYLDEAALENFTPSVAEYTYVHPYGTDEADFFTIDDLTYVLSDSLATAESTISDDHTLSITVTAQNGKQKSYFIIQKVGKDNNADLAWITVDGDTLQGFDPDQTFYIYDVYKGAATPSIAAKQASENASDPTVGEVSQAGDTCRITVQAAAGNIKVYEVYIREGLDKSQEATANDVLIKRVPGAMQLAAYTVRQGVSIALYDQYGHLLYNERVPVANPNDTEIVEDSDQKEFLNDVASFNSGLIIDVLPGQPYFYCFYYNGKKKLASGKIMCY